MARYYFDVRDGEVLTRDDEGLEFRGIDAASDEAARTLAEIACDVLPGAAHRVLAIEVRDETRELVLKAQLTFEIARSR